MKAFFIAIFMHSAAVKLIKQSVTTCKCVPGNFLWFAYCLFNDTHSRPDYIYESCAEQHAYEQFHVLYVFN
jgi:hypothetical protein